MRFWAILIAVISVSGVVGKIAYDLKQAGKTEIENVELKQENKDVKNEAQSYANRPRTNDDIVDRLCEWGKYQLKSEGKSEREIPVHCR